MGRERGVLAELEGSSPRSSTLDSKRGRQVDPKKERARCARGDLDDELEVPEMFRLSMVAAISLSLLVAPGCSLFAPHSQTLQVTASDPDAEIIINGSYQGRGAVAVRVPRNQSQAVMARVGDRVGTASVQPVISTTGVLDVVGTFFFLFPILGVISPGFFKLERDSITVVVPPGKATGRNPLAAVPLGGLEGDR